MFAYRVFPYLVGAAEGDPGSPTYLHPTQGKGRLDNPGEYLVWYFALEPTGAVGEVFADQPFFSEDMFDVPFLAGARRSLGTYLLPDDVTLLELDDARALFTRGLRPTQVVERNRSATQSWALDVHRERNDRGDRMWCGVRWWSYHRPGWRIVGAWDVHPEVVAVDDLTLKHPAVVDAARTLKKQIINP